MLLAAGAIATIAAALTFALVSSIETARLACIRAVDQNYQRTSTDWM
jgi:hypothetical protein